MLITIIGKGGSGKSTLASIIAKVISSQGSQTLLTQAETRYAVIQRRFDKSIGNSMYYGYLNGFQGGEFFVQAQRNLYLLSMADYDDFRSFNEIDEDILNSSIDSLMENFDTIVVDGTSRVNDQLTMNYIKRSDVIINLVDSSIDGIAYDLAHKDLYKIDVFKRTKFLNVLTRYKERVLNLESIENTLEKKFDLVLEYDDSVEFQLLQNIYPKALNAKVKDFITKFS